MLRVFLYYMWMISFNFDLKLESVIHLLVYGRIIWMIWICVAIVLIILMILHGRSMWMI